MLPAFDTGSLTFGSIELGETGTPTNPFRAHLHGRLPSMGLQSFCWVL